MNLFFSLLFWGIIVRGKYNVLIYKIFNRRILRNYFIFLFNSFLNKSS